jgi:hypothetical protein
LSLAAECKALFFHLLDAKAVTGAHSQRATDIADRARQRLIEKNVTATIGGRPVWWDS